MSYLDEDNVCAGFSEGNCHCGANAAGSAGDKGGLALEGEEGRDCVCHFLDCGLNCGERFEINGGASAIYLEEGAGHPD